MSNSNKGKSNGYYPDLEFPGLGPLNSLAILILIEMDYLGGSKTYKQVFASTSPHGVVIAYPPLYLKFVIFGVFFNRFSGAF